METMVQRPGHPDHHPPKRKRVAGSRRLVDASNGVAALATPSTSSLACGASSSSQLQQDGARYPYHWPDDPGSGGTETAGSEPAALVASCNADLPSVQTHRDTRLRHRTRTLAQASHHDNMQPVQPCMPYPVFAQSSGHADPHVMPIAGHHQGPEENGFTLFESHSSAAGLLSYDPSFHHEISALEPGQLTEGHTHLQHHIPDPAPAPALGSPQPATSYTAPRAVYYGDRPHQEVHIAGPGHINSVTAASRGSCVTDCLRSMHPGSTHPTSVSGQESVAGGASLRFQPLTALSPVPYTNQDLIFHFVDFPIQNGLATDASKQVTAFQHPAEAPILYEPSQFNFQPSFSVQSTMGGGDVYPVHPQAEGDGPSIGVPDQHRPPKLAGREHFQSNTDRQYVQSGRDVVQCSPQTEKHSVSYAAAPANGTIGQNEWVEQGASVSELDSTSRKAKKRSAFDEVRRRETADTRSRKACLRCRIQKGRCEVDPRDVDGECLKCQSYSKESKKTIHHIPCYRNKLTDTVLFRKGGLNLTTRWEGTAMKDVGDRITPPDIRTIHFTLGVCDQPLVVEVARFSARPGDVTARYWTVREGIRGDEVRKKKELETYCLVNIWTTGNYFEKYVIDNAIPSIMKQNTPSIRLRGLPPATPNIIQRTYTMAVEYYLSLESEVEGPDGKKPNQEKALLGNVFVLWFAIRHTTGSAYICGEEKLGMKPEVKDETYPLYGKVSLPRMILAQFDSINSTKLLGKYAHRVLTGLEFYMTSSQPRWWWTVYLCSFILLREASFISADRYRHARNNHGAKLRYSVPQFVEELQAGCNNILMHWHYYNRWPWPNPREPETRHKGFMGELSSEQHKLVMDTLVDPTVSGQLSIWKECRENNGRMKRREVQPGPSSETPYEGSQAQLDWDHPLYWVSQLFEEMWRPHRTYEREYES